MFAVILIALLLVAISTTVQAVGLAVLLRWLTRLGPDTPVALLPVTWLLIRVVWWLIVLHATVIAIWALGYWALGCLPDAESAIYFSGVTYATVGFGDLLLPQPWRILGPIEGLTGILMCGLSTGYFFAIASRLYSVASRGEGR